MHGGDRGVVDEMNPNLDKLAEEPHEMIMEYASKRRKLKKEDFERL